MNLRKGQRLPPRSAEHRRKLADAARGNQRAARVLREWAERRRVVFDAGMAAESERLLRRGWNREAIAEAIGVSRGVLRRHLHTHQSQQTTAAQATDPNSRSAISCT